MTTAPPIAQPPADLIEAQARTRSARSRLETVQAKHAEAEKDLGALRQQLADERTHLHDAIARAALGDAPAPSRTALARLEAALPAAEDQVAGLAAAVRTVRAEVNHTRADELVAEATAIRAETAQRQARIHELQAEIGERQRELNECSSWINNYAARASQPDAEAQQLRIAGLKT